MNNKTIYPIASLVMAFVMILGNTIHTQAETPVAQAAGPSIYWGAMVDGKVPSSTNMQQGAVFDTFEAHSKKKMAIIHFGESWMMTDGSWGEFHPEWFDNARNHGSIPMITWASQRLGYGTNQPDFQLRDVYEGKYDDYIQRWASAAKSWGHPFFLRFDAEMNGWWLPWGEGKLSSGEIVNGNSAGDFVKAWCHVHDIFTAVGATNVTWVWAPNIIGTESRYPALSSLYPGDSYVDWTGLSVYNKYSVWLGLNPLLTSSGLTWLKNSYNEVLTVAPNKPMMLAEWASIEAGDGGAKKAAWITDALTVQIPTNFPKIKAVVWFNWQQTAGETFPIESSQAATDAWAASIGSAVYATNQYANLNTSPIPPLVPVNISISGNVGAAGVTLSYTDGAPKTVTSQADGSYSLLIPYNWSGTVTPSHSCFTFTPANKSYTNVTTNKTVQNYTPIFNAASGCANIHVTIGSNPAWEYGLAEHTSTRARYPSVNSGPVNVAGTNANLLITSQRVIFGGKSYSEMMGLPLEQLSKEYWFPYYNNVAMDSQLRVSNVGNVPTTIDVYLGTQQIDSYTLAAGSATRKNYSGKNAGPLKVTSSDTNILSTIRVLFNGSSYSEMMGLPKEQLSKQYLFPYYNNVAMDSQLRVSNLGNVPTTITVYLGTQPIDSYTLAAGSATRKNYVGKNAGPLKVTSSDTNILSTVRVLYAGSSYSEMMGLPLEQLAQEYWYPVYDNSALDSQLRVSNVGNGPTTITVYAGSTQIDSYSLNAGAATRKNYAQNTGPLHVVSNPEPILSTIRMLYTTPSFSSYYEMMGLPDTLLSTQYFFPWYNNVAMNSELRFAVP